jgi:hypothetical protein
MPERIAIVRGNDITWDRLHQYLPNNYYVVGLIQGGAVIAGEDRFGWTFEDYIEPRLASGLMFAKEVTDGR